MMILLFRAIRSRIPESGAIDCMAQVSSAAARGEIVFSDDPGPRNFSRSGRRAAPVLDLHPDAGAGES